MPKKKTVKESSIQTKLSSDFYSDIDLPNMLYAVLIRAPKNSGLFAGITAPELPEGYTIFTAKDIPGTNSVTIMGTPIPIFCDGRVKYLGEPIGILTGPDETTVNTILNEIHVVLHDANEDASPETKQPFVKELKTGAATKSEEAFETILKKSSKQFKETWSFAINPPSFSEPEGAVCFIKKGVFHVCTATTWISNLRNTLSAALNLESEKIAVIKTKSQPYSCNGDWRNAIIASQAGIAAVKTGRPVKLCVSQQEQTQIIECTPPTETTYHTSIDDDGKITAMKITINIDIGAYNPFTEELLNRLIISACGVYNIKNLHIIAKAYCSRVPPSLMNSENVSAQIFFGIENQINKIAEITGILPEELRIKNMCLGVQRNLMPYKLTLEAPDETLNAVVSACDFKRKFITNRIDYQERQKTFNALEKFPLRGIGLSCAFNGSGYYGNSIYANDQKMEATLETDGSLTIHAMPPSSSILGIWKETAAKLLDLDVKNIHINSVFEHDKEPLLPESVYSNLSVMNQLLKKCCESIQRKRFRSPLPISVSKSISMSQKKQWDVQTFTGQPYHSTAFVSAVVELELDPCTFRCTLRGIWVVIDSGKILIESEAQSRINLEINQTLCCLMDEDELDCAKISISFIHSQNEPKQLHGLIANVIPAAFSSALSQAISETITSIPVKEDLLFIKGAFKPEETLYDIEQESISLDEEPSAVKPEEGLKS